MRKRSRSPAETVSEVSPLQKTDCAERRILRPCPEPNQLLPVRQMHSEDDQVRIASQITKNPMRHTKLAQVRTAAALFVKDRDAAKIAKAISRDERTVYALIKREDFNAELDALGYTGPRNFRTQPKRVRGRDKKRNRTRHSPERAKAIRLYQSMTDIPNTNALAVLLK